MAIIHTRQFSTGNRFGGPTLTCRISLAAAGMALLSLAAVSGGAAEHKRMRQAMPAQHGAAQLTKIRAAVIG
jgi:hypothetical protein